jgi:hypothetical protein
MATRDGGAVSPRADENGAAFAGSQLQTQLYINKRTADLDSALRSEFDDELSNAEFDWRTPLAADGYAEYYGSAFLKRLGLDEHVQALKEFWPARGPQWDALAVVTRPGQRPGVLLGEGKSYPDEMLKGSGTTSEAGTDNRKRIDVALAWTQQQLGVQGKTPSDWAGALYQNANRLAHLCWLNDRDVDAWLVHLLFVDDPHEPTTEKQWSAAVDTADERLGLAGLDVPRAGHVMLAAGTREELVA